MGANLRKGGNTSLVKANNSPLRRAVVACGWDVNTARGEADYDCDLTAAALNASGTVPATMDPSDPGYQEWFIHANHRHPSDGSIVFMGDNRTGKGDGDDEMIKLDLARIPAYIDRIVFSVVIWRAAERGQRFGKVQNAFIRIFDEETREEIARFDIGAEFSDETLVMFGELYRRGTEWKFRAIAQGYEAIEYRREFNIQRAFETEYARAGYSG